MSTQPVQGGAVSTRVSVRRGAGARLLRLAVVPGRATGFRAAHHSVGTLAAGRDRRARHIWRFAVDAWGWGRDGQLRGWRIALAECTRRVCVSSGWATVGGAAAGVLHDGGHGARACKRGRGIVASYTSTPATCAAPHARRLPARPHRTPSRSTSCRRPPTPCCTTSCRL